MSKTPVRSEADAKQEAVTHQEVRESANAQARRSMAAQEGKEEAARPKTCGQHFSESVTVSSFLIGASLLVAVGCVIALGSYFMFDAQEVGAVAQIQFKDVLSSHASILLIMGIAVVILILGILLKNSCGPCDAKLKTCVSALGRMCCFGGKGDSRQKQQFADAERSTQKF